MGEINRDFRKQMFKEVSYHIKTWPRKKQCVNKFLFISRYWKKLFWECSLLTNRNRNYNKCIYRFRKKITQLRISRKTTTNEARLTKIILWYVDNVVHQQASGASREPWPQQNSVRETSHLGTGICSALMNIWNSCFKQVQQNSGDNG